MPQKLIEFQNVTLAYGRKTVLSSLSFDICSGDFLGIVGPNGAGKSTVLKAILGILRPAAGRVVMNRQNGGRNAKPRFGYVPQRGQLDEIYPFTVAEIVLMGRYAQIGVLRKPKAQDYEKTNESLSHLGISHLANRPYASLSGGQKQRALIARALAGDPDILLLDEPTDGLDLFSQKTILDLIARFHQEYRLTIVMVSHQLDAIATYVQKLALVDLDYFQIGSKEEVLTESRLEEVYGIPVKVEDRYGRKIILPGVNHA